MCGEGGLLRLPDSACFMHTFDGRTELAPRCIIARAIEHKMKRLGINHILLDISHKHEGCLKEHFPTIYTGCLT